MALIPNHQEDKSEYFEFVYFAAILIMFGLIHRLSQCQRLLWFPEASLQMLVGLVVTLLIIYFTGFRNSFNANLFFLVLLPPIMFNSGLDVNIKYFYRNFVAIMVFANIGTLINALIVGGICYQFGIDGRSERISRNEAYSFGSLISATDPVTTIAVFDSLRVEPHLYSIVVGVSILDDAVAVILFNLFTEYHSGRGNVTVAFVAIGHFLAKLFVSMILGYIFGIIFAWYLKLNPQLIRRVPLYLATVVMFVYCSYLIGEVSTLSGIITTMFSAISLCKYYNKWSPENFAILKHAVNGWSYVFESMVFFNIGLTLLRHYPQNKREFQFIGISLFSCFIGRVAQIYPLSLFLNWYNLRPVVIGVRNGGKSVIKRGSKSLVRTTDVEIDASDVSNVPPPTTLVAPSSESGRPISISSTIAAIDGKEAEPISNQNHHNHQELSVSKSSAQRIDPSLCFVPPPKSVRPSPRTLLRKRGVILSWGYQHMILFAGLRGPIAYATARLISKNSVHRGMFISATNFTVAVTTFLLGALTVPALHWFDIKYGAAVVEWERQQEAELEAAERLILAESDDDSVEDEGMQRRRDHGYVTVDFEMAPTALSTTGGVAGIVPESTETQRQSFDSVPRAKTVTWESLKNSLIAFCRLWHFHMTIDEILEIGRHYEYELITRHFVHVSEYLSKPVSEQVHHFVQGDDKDIAEERKEKRNG